MIVKVNAQRAISSVAFIVIGAFASLHSHNYSYGTVTTPGPGFFPFLIGLLLVGLGSAGLFVSLFEPRAEDLTNLWSKGVIFVPLGILAFALLIDRLGLALTVLVSTLICSFGTQKIRWVESALLSLGVMLFAVAVFHFGLGLPISLLPP